MGTPVTIELTGDEALVLFEWLAKLEETNPVEGEAEKRAVGVALVEGFDEHPRARAPSAQVVDTWGQNGG